MKQTKLWMLAAIRASRYILFRERECCERLDIFSFTNEDIFGHQTDQKESLRQSVGLPDGAKGKQSGISGEPTRHRHPFWSSAADGIPYSAPAASGST
jgi:hypothetical protein